MIDLQGRTKCCSNHSVGYQQINHPELRLIEMMCAGPDFISTDIVGAYKLLKAVITIVAAVLSERGYTPSGEVTFDTNISLPMKHTEDFGYAYFLAGTGPLSGAEYSKGDHSVAGNLSASLSPFCVLGAEFFCSGLLCWMSHR